jgi:hypothetical protein
LTCLAQVADSGACAGEGRLVIESDAYAGVTAERAAARPHDAPRWPRPLRVIFIVTAAAACWAVPVVLCYCYFLR